MTKKKALFELRLILGELEFTKKGILETQLRYWTDDEIENGKTIEFPKSLTDRIDAIQLAIKQIEKSMK